MKAVCYKGKYIPWLLTAELVQTGGASTVVLGHEPGWQDVHELAGVFVRGHLDNVQFVY